MIDWMQVVTDTISGLIVGVILAGLGYIFINKYTQSIAFAKDSAEANRLRELRKPKTT